MKNIKLIVGIIVGLLLGGITAYAATKITAREVPYTNSKLSGVTNVKGAIDSLYTKAANLTCPIGYKCDPKYYVSYDACSGSGAPSNTTHTYGVASNISSTEPTRSDYTFQGWSKTSCSGSVDLSSGASITNLSSTPGSTVTLYAIWKSNSCEYECRNGWYATYVNGEMTSCKHLDSSYSLATHTSTYYFTTCNITSLGGPLYMCKYKGTVVKGYAPCRTCHSSMYCGVFEAGSCPETYECP